MLELQELCVWGLAQKAHCATPVPINFEANFLGSLRGVSAVALQTHQFDNLH